MSVDGSIGRNFGSGQFCEGGQQVCRGSDRLGLDTSRDRSWPPSERRLAHVAFVLGPHLPSSERTNLGTAIVGSEHDERVLSQVQLS